VREKLCASYPAVRESVPRVSLAGEVHVTAAIASGELWVLIADDGCGFQSPSLQPGQGWGLALIASAADSFEVAPRSNGGTELRNHFAISLDPGEAD
jgi:nitrate/nitrite-specific signal transduction histidine kinase